MKENGIMHFAFNQDRRFCENYRAKDMDLKDNSASASYPLVVLPGQVAKHKRKNIQSTAGDAWRKEMILDELARANLPQMMSPRAEVEIDMREINQYEKSIMQRQKALKLGCASPRRI